MNTILLGDKKTFGITATFFEDVHMTELSMFAKGKNILAFRQGNEIFTTRWNLDELVLWLKNFISNLSEDPYPVDVAGIYAAEKDDNARNFDSDDEDVFDAYYDKLYEWNERHRWHPASSGAILADVYVQLAGENMEISWDNRKLEYEDVEFLETMGGISIPKDDFISIMNEFLKAYANRGYWNNPPALQNLSSFTIRGCCKYYCGNLFFLVWPAW